jgi:hypothetical protein
MTTLSFNEFYDQGLEIMGSGTYEQYVDLGEGGDCEIAVEPDSLIEGGYIEGCIDYVCIEVETIAAQAKEEEEVKPLLAALIELVGLDVILGYLAEVEEEEDN